MTVARTARRRRRQHIIGFTHIAKLGRPKYRRRELLSVGDAIQAEKMRAARQAAAKGKKK